MALQNIALFELFCTILYCEKTLFSINCPAPLLPMSSMSSEEGSQPGGQEASEGSTQGGSQEGGKHKYQGGPGEGEGSGVWPVCSVKVCSVYCLLFSVQCSV